MKEIKHTALAKRASEVELFSGTIIKLASKHGIQVPVNELYYHKIKQIESEYSVY